MTDIPDVRTVLAADLPTKLRGKVCTGIRLVDTHCLVIEFEGGYAIQAGAYNNGSDSVAGTMEVVLVKPIPTHFQVVRSTQ